jgi:hypothetical protein
VWQQYTPSTSTPAEHPALALPAQQQRLARSRQLPLQLLQVLLLLPKPARPALLLQLQRGQSLLLPAWLAQLLQQQQAKRAKQLQAAKQDKAQQLSRLHSLHLKLPPTSKQQQQQQQQHLQQQVQGGQEQGPRQGVQVQVAPASQQVRVRGALLQNPQKDLAWGQLYGPWPLWV